MFPWQSASDGRDETPSLLYNVRSGRWMEDRSRHQRHIGLAVAFNFWQYFQVSGDTEQMFESGLEVIVEVARFFADLAHFDADLGRYRIRGVMGPDEFHDGYPWSEAPGVDDNAYTNVMAAWLFARVSELVALARRSGRTEALDRIGISDDELAHFEDISTRLYVPFIGDVLAQFDGYDRLEVLDLEAYRARYGDIGRLDLILDAEGDTVRRYQVSKQADALMLLYLFSAEELRSVLGRLGYSFDADAIRHTIDYYTARTTHGSSLSRVVYAWITARLDRHSSWEYLSEALSFDLLDVNRGSTREGVHLGAMAGTVDIFERCYTGLEIRSDALWLNPLLPLEIESLAFPLSYRGHRLALTITHARVEVTAPSGQASPVSLHIAGVSHELQAGGRIVHLLESDRQSGLGIRRESTQSGPLALPGTCPDS
jgi:trehalose/maltose hydrolase-like predicted phosphorylase